MADDSGVVGEGAKFVRLDPVFFDALIRVCGVILMHCAARALDPMFAERVCTAERVGFRCCAIHDEILQIEGQDSKACAETISMSMQSRNRSMTLKSLVPS